MKNRFILPLRLHFQTTDDFTALDYLRERYQLHSEVSLTQISRILKHSIAGVMLYFYLQSFSVNSDRVTPKKFGKESRLGKGIKNMLNYKYNAAIPLFDANTIAL